MEGVCAYACASVRCGALEWVLCSSLAFLSSPRAGTCRAEAHIARRPAVELQAGDDSARLLAPENRRIDSSSVRTLPHSYSVFLRHANSTLSLSLSRAVPLPLVLNCSGPSPQGRRQPPPPSLSTQVFSLLLWITRLLAFSFRSLFARSIHLIAPTVWSLAYLVRLVIDSLRCLRFNPSSPHPRTSGTLCPFHLQYIFTQRHSS